MPRKPEGFSCTECNTITRCTEVRRYRGKIPYRIRRFLCPFCSHTFSTWETLEPPVMLPAERLERMRVELSTALTEVKALQREMLHGQKDTRSGS